MMLVFSYNEEGAELRLVYVLHTYPMIPRIALRPNCLRICTFVKRRTSILLWAATPTHIIAYGAAPTATVEGRPWWNF